MSFLADDEFLLLMDIAHINETGVDVDFIDETGLKMLLDSGIKTTMPFQCMWNSIEKKEGVFDWSVLDKYVERTTKVGMKTILFSATHYPQWFPDDWYPKDGLGNIHKEALSPWNKEAQERNNSFSRMVIQRYSSDQCLVVSPQLLCGETMFLNVAGFYGPHAIKDFHEKTGLDVPHPGDPITDEWLKNSLLNMLLEQQRIFVENKFREIYTALHIAIGHFSFYGNGNKWIEDILQLWTSELKPNKIIHIYYTWIQWGQFWSKINEWKTNFNEDVFGGAEYCEGLPTTTPIAINNGLRGQIVAPCYPGQHDHVEDWMCNNIRNSISLFKQTKGIL
jgi:hypothetical protein